MENRKASNQPFRELEQHVANIRSPDPIVQAAAVSIIKQEVIHASSVQIKNVVNAGGFFNLLSLIDYSQIDRRDMIPQALHALAKIINGWPLNNCDLLYYGSQLRDFCINFGLVEKLVASNFHVSFPREVAFIILAICEKGEPPLHVGTIRKLLPIFKHLILDPDTMVLLNSLIALRYITHGSHEEIQKIFIDDHVISSLVPLLSHRDSRVQRNALRNVANILAGNEDLFALYISNNKIMDYLEASLDHSDEWVQNEALRFVSKVVANPKQVQVIFDAGLVRNIFQHLSSGESLVKRRSSVLAISNLIVNGRKNQVMHLVYECGIIPPFCGLFYLEEPKIVSAILSGLSTILRMITPGLERNHTVQLIKDHLCLKTFRRIMEAGCNANSRLARNIYEYYFSLEASYK